MDPTLKANGVELRLTDRQLNLPLDIVLAAREHPGDLPQQQRDRIFGYIDSLQEELALIYTKIESQDHRDIVSCPNQDLAAHIFLRQRITACEGILSPARRLSAETLRQIFEEYIQIDKENHLEAGSPPGQSPDSVQPRGRALLLLICRWWHSVALGHLPLWTDVGLKAQYHQAGHQPCVLNEFVPDILALLTAVHTSSWTLRINGVPKQDYRAYWKAPPFDSEAGLPVSASNDVTTLPQLFAQHPAACSTLTKLSLDVVQHAIGMHGVVFPNVTSLLVRGRFYTYENGMLRRHRENADSVTRTEEAQLNGTVKSFPDIPALTHAVFEGEVLVLRNGVLLPRNINWSQLTHLAVGNLTRYEWRTLIRRCTNLVKGQFRLVRKTNWIFTRSQWPFPRRSAQGDPGIVDMPNALYGGIELVVLERLEELTLFGVSPFPGYAIISPTDGMRFPQLKKLRMFLDGPSMNQAMVGLDYWDSYRAGRLFPQLTHLTLMRTEIRGQHAARVLGSVGDTLEEVFIRITENLGGLLGYLTFAAGRFNLKRLRALGIRVKGVGGCWGEGEEGQTLCPVLDGFLQSRIADVWRNKFQDQVSAGLVPLETFVFQSESEDSREGNEEFDQAKNRIQSLKRLAEKYKHWGTKITFGIRDEKNAFLGKHKGLDRHWGEGLGRIFEENEYEYRLHV